MTEQMQQMGMVMKFRGDIEDKKQEGETKRELMRVTTKAHEVEETIRAENERRAMEDRTWIEDIRTKAQTALTVEEMQGHVALLLARIEERGADRDRESDRQTGNAEKRAKE